MTQDSFRSHLNYPVNYFFAMVQTALTDGRTLGIIMGDGFGSSYASKTSNEDFLTLDGMAKKLDVTLLEEDPSDIMSLKHLRSANLNRFGASCDLVYEPKYKQDNVIYLVLISFQQRATYGRFSGTCQVDGEQIKIESWGFFEHVHMRW